MAKPAAGLRRLDSRAAAKPQPGKSLFRAEPRKKRCDQRWKTRNCESGLAGEAFYVISIQHNPP
jgi:hypothetical protein